VRAAVAEPQQHIFVVQELSHAFRARVERLHGELVLEIVFQRDVQLIPAFRTSNGIASTFTRSRIAISLALGLQGAMPTPQFPITTVVTPCQLDGVVAPSQQIWAS
jgi:hypothetical protein